LRQELGQQLLVGTELSVVVWSIAEDATREDDDAVPEHIVLLAGSLLESAAGAVIGAGVLLAISLSYLLIRRIEGMGAGDTKMLAYIGAVTGWKGLFPLMLIASITGSVVGVLVAMRSEKGMQVAVPFGVFLGMAFLVVIFFGPTLSSWYVALLLR